MDLALTLLLVAGAALLLFVLAASAMTLTAIRRLRLLPPEIQALDELPAEASSALAPGLAVVEALGFGAPQALRVLALSSAGRPLPQHALVLTHADGAAAYLLQLVVPDRGRVFTLYFVSRTADGQTLVTRNRASIAGALDLPDTETQDLWLPSWAAVWQAHRARMQALRADATAWLRWPAEAWVAAGALAERQAFERRVQSGDYLPVGDGSYRIGARAALRMLGRAWAVFGPSQRGMEDDAAHPPAGVKEQIERFEREQQAAHSTRRSAGAKWGLFLITAAAAALSFGLSLDWAVLPALLGVLLFHELGHLVAMRLCGYRDLQVFFLPFMGAAVSGRAERPTAGRELFVLLAGPLPGLLLGLAGLLWLPTEASWLRNTAWFAVLLNAFNLLPFHPLDGGKVFELLLLGRWPWAAFTGRALGLLALAAWVLDGEAGIGRTVFLGALLLMALGLQHQARQARLARHLQAQGQWGGLSPVAALQALFQGLQALGLGRLPWAEQKLLVQALLPLAQQPRLGWTARAGGLLLYAFCLALPLLAAGLHFGRLRAPEPPAVSAGEPHAEPDAQAQAAGMAAYRAQRNQELQALRGRLATLDPAAQWRLLADELDAVSIELAAQPPGSLPAAEALLAEAARLAPRLPDPLARQTQLALWQAQARAEPAERQALLEQAMARYEQPEAANADPAPLFRATALWLELPLASDPAQRQAHLARALARGAGSAIGPDAAGLRRQHLDALHARAESAAVFEQLRAWQEAASPDADWLEDLAQLQLDASVASGGAAAGLELLDRLLPALQAAPGAGPHTGEALRRQGLWLAETVGRSEWQRAQVSKLPAPAAAPAPGLMVRVLLWVSGAPSGTPISLREVEEAHWRGDSAAAQAAAQRWRAQTGRAAPPLPELEGLEGLAARRLQLTQQGRRTLLARYGLQ